MKHINKEIAQKITLEASKEWASKELEMVIKQIEEQASLGNCKALVWISTNAYLYIKTHLEKNGFYCIQLLSANTQVQVEIDWS